MTEILNNALNYAEGGAATGVKTYGLILDYVVVTDLGILISQERMFLARTSLSHMSREKGEVRGIWKAHNYHNYETARCAMIESIVSNENLHKGRVFPTTQPLLVELTSTDIAQIQQGEMPHSRHRGTLALNNAGANISDDKIWDLVGGDVLDPESF